ncbi:MAG: response regulator transcription factor [Planctomycetota bacterium]|nr:response regulator transcription factor [Planctomycetota bacterium]
MNARQRVLVVEDDAAIRRGLCDALRFAGYNPVEAVDGKAGLDAALTASPDLVLLDVLMPRMDGFAVLKEIRNALPQLPVIMLTAKGEEQDRVRGLRDGADDYVVKPFSATELLARVAAVLRRTPERPADTQKATIAGRSIDLARREVVFDDGRRAALSEREAQTLSYLIRNPGRAIARDELLKSVWGLDPRGVHTRTVDMTIARLRELLQDDPNNPRVIVTVRAKGYMIANERGEFPEAGEAS